MHKCQHPGCHFTTETPQGLNAHSISHLPQEEKDRRKAKRAETIAAKKYVAAVNKPTVNDIFNRIEQATKILFPDPAIFYERFEEIAELRNQMLQALTR